MRAALAVAGIALGALTDLGCDSGAYGCEPWESPCPTPFDVRAWCLRTNHCTIDGATGFDRHLQRGETLGVPIGEFAASLALVHSLYVFYTAPTGTPRPDASRAIVTIDGVPAATSAGGPSQWDAWAEWTPFPAAPVLLELRFEDGGNGQVTLDLTFFDRACEEANPEPPCAV